MLRFRLLFLLLLILPFAFVSAQDAPTATVTVSRLNVRIDPNTRAEIVTQVRYNQMFNVIGRTETGTWWQIQVDHRAGWVYGRYVRVHGDTSQVAVLNVSAMRPTPIPYPTIAPPTCVSVPTLVRLPNADLCPLTLIQSVSAAYQPFEHGFMIWLSDSNDILVLTNQTGFIVSLPNYVNLPDLSQDVPANGVRVINGFGRVWWNDVYGARVLLGAALMPESGYRAAYQWIHDRVNDQNLLFVMRPDGGVIAVNPNGGWYSIS